MVFVLWSYAYAIFFFLEAQQIKAIPYNMQRKSLAFCFPLLTSDIKAGSLNEKKGCISNNMKVGALFRRAVPKATAWHVVTRVAWMVGIMILPVIAYLVSNSKPSAQAILREAIPLMLLVVVGYGGASFFPAIFAKDMLAGAQLHAPHPLSLNQPAFVLVYRVQASAALCTTWRFRPRSSRQARLFLPPTCCCPLV